LYPHQIVKIMFSEMKFVRGFLTEFYGKEVMEKHNGLLKQKVLEYNRLLNHGTGNQTCSASRCTSSA